MILLYTHPRCTRACSFPQPNPMHHHHHHHHHVTMPRAPVGGGGRPIRLELPGVVDSRLSAGTWMGGYGSLVEGGLNGTLTADGGILPFGRLARTKSGEHPFGKRGHAGLPRVGGGRRAGGLRFVAVCETGKGNPNPLRPSPPLPDGCDRTPGDTQQPTRATATWRWSGRIELAIWARVDAMACMEVTDKYK